MKHSIVRRRHARLPGNTARWDSALLLTLLAAAPAGAAVQFGVTDLATLGGSLSSAAGINAAGQVVGYAYTGGDTAQRAFLWQSGAMQDLGTLGGDESSAYGINAAGQVVGNAAIAGGLESRAFLWQAGSMQDLGTLGGALSDAAGINAAGQVVGYAYTGTPSCAVRTAAWST